MIFGLGGNSGEWRWFDRASLHACTALYSHTTTSQHYVDTDLPPGGCMVIPNHVLIAAGGMIADNYDKRLHTAVEPLTIPRLPTYRPSAVACFHNSSLRHKGGIAAALQSKVTT